MVISVLKLKQKNIKMNERIQELSEQAEKYADDNFRGDPTWSEAFESKFAELIVKECARVIDRGDGEMSSMAETIWCNVCRDDILKHFGVEQ